MTFSERVRRWLQHRLEITSPSTGECACRCGIVWPLAHATGFELDGIAIRWYRIEREWLESDASLRARCLSTRKEWFGSGVNE